MTHGQEFLPWLPAAYVEALLRGSELDPWLVWRTAGQLLRAPAVPSNLTRAVRARLVDVLESTELTALADRAELEVEAFFHLVEHPEETPERPRSLARARDDLESVRAGFAAALLAAIDEGRDDDAHFVVEDRIDAALAAADEAIDPLLPSLRRSVVETRPQSPELEAMRSSGPNPWWLELFDDRWRALWAEGLPQLRVKKRAFGATKGARTTLRFDGELTLDLYRDQDGKLVALLDDPTRRLSAAHTLEIVWDGAGGERAAPLKPTAEGLYEGAPPDDVLASTIVALRIDGSQLELSLEESGAP